MKIIKSEKPWGIAELLTHNQQSTIQVLRIKKWDSLSLHYHKIRNDYWYIISGEGIATVGENEIKVAAGNTIYLEKETLHNVTSLSEELIVLEVCFDHFDIEDTYRVSDKYGRV